MAIEFEGIDHIHVHVKDRAAAEKWYAQVLGLGRIAELAFWAADGGPLTIANESGTIHLALFEGRPVQNTTIALKVDAAGLTRFIAHLQGRGIMVEPVDHDVSWSIYFRDPDGNPYEVTTYAYQEFRQASVAATGGQT